MKRIALDIETNMAHDVIHLCVTQDIDTGEVKVWKAPTGLWDYLKDATLIAAHNGCSFDFVILNKFWKTKIGLKQAYDTLIVSRLVEPTRDGGHSLDAWGKTLGVKKLDYRATWQWMVNREEAYAGECFDAPVDVLLEHYCVRDVSVLRTLFTQLETLLLDKGFSEESVRLEHQVASIIHKQEKNGFKLDTIYATCLLAELKGKMSAINDRMQEEYPPYEVERISSKTGKLLKPESITFNPASRQQIAEKLIALGWKPKKFTEPTSSHPNGQAIVDESTLMGLKWPLAQFVAEYMMLGKRIAQIESWLEVLGADGRVHGRVITNGAVTGRATHSKPNMAQIPNTSSQYGKECRQCWTVEEGNVLVGVDLSGIELRCFAHYLQDEDYIKEVVYGDVHTRNQQAFGVDSRNDAKTILYATLYGASPSKIGTIVGASKARGQAIINGFRRSVPAFDVLQKKVAAYAQKGWIPGLDGRRLTIRSEHSALNTLLQSAGAIIAKQWIVCIDKKLRQEQISYKLVAWVHDEVQIETSPDDAEKVGKLVVECAKEAGEILKFRCPVSAEWKSGKNWYDCH
jgi:DNA polymerase I-like protein with 3'-5' exonuclease and polymerase domains